MSRIASTASGLTAYVWPPNSNGSRVTSSASFRPSPEVSRRRPRSKLSVRGAIAPSRLALRLRGLVGQLRELGLEDLARRVARQLVEEDDVTRDLVARE